MNTAAILMGRAKGGEEKRGWLISLSPRLKRRAIAPTIQKDEGNRKRKNKKMTEKIRGFGNVRKSG